MILFIPHGGGPLPLLNAPGHLNLVNFLTQFPNKIPKPGVIIVISAHWEEQSLQITSSNHPQLIYDYTGFPKAAYELEYPAQGSPKLADELFNLFSQENINVQENKERGFDHGLFVPLKLMYPKADIPCIQISLLKNLDPLAHINIGKVLRKIKQPNILILGSGFSFHHMEYFFNQDPNANHKNDVFQDWLIETCCQDNYKAEEKLISWTNAPYATFCHPRAEHLMPLFVCQGASQKPARLIFNAQVLNKRSVGFLWE